MGTEHYSGSNRLSGGVVTFFPDYRSSNPYQDLLYRRLGDFSFEPGDIAMAITRLRASSGVNYIFHLHWTSPILGLEPSRERSKERMAAFLNDLQLFKNEGGRFIWTIHNILPHECIHVDIEVALHQRLCELADVIHVHSEQTISLAADKYKIPTNKTVVGPHGSYLGVYPLDISRAEARSRFGFSIDDVVLLFFGQIRTYKGVERLLSSHQAILDRDQRVRLIVAGSPNHLPSGLIASWEKQYPSARLEMRKIPDQEVQVFFAAADVAILPYHNVLTSGSAYLALSFGLPVIAPHLGLITEVIEDGVNGLIYDDAENEALEHALLRFCSLAPAVQSKLRDSARASAVALEWGQAGRALAKAFARQSDQSESTRDQLVRPS